MKTARFIQNGLPEGILAKASLEELVPWAKIGHFSSNSVICSGDHLGDCAYFVLKGKCELRRQFSDHGTSVIRTFGPGEAFGGSVNPPAAPTGEVVAVEESVVLAVRVEDLAKLQAQTEGEVEAIREESPGANPGFFFNNKNSRLISLVFLSDSVPAEALGEKIARQLRVETGEPVILVEFAPGAVNGAAANGHSLYHELNGSAVLPPRFTRDDHGLIRLRLKLSGASPDPEVIGELFRKLRRHFQFVVSSVRAKDLPREYLFGCVSQSDAAHFLLRPSAETLYELDLFVHELRARLLRPRAVELKSILCLASDEKIGDADNRIIEMGITSPELIRDCPPRNAVLASPLQVEGTRLFQTDIRRVARSMGKCLVGLALSSGGAKGLAHIGVIQVLEENGIDVDVIAGASMGAYVGAIWAYGQSGDELEKRAREMETKRAMWTLLDPVPLPWQGFMRGYAVKRRLQKSIGEAQFSDLTRSLRVVAAHLDTMERVVFSTGDVATAVHASFAVPGICVPVPIGGELYVDGGIVDPLPTDVLQEMGVGKIIAVNTIPTPERIRYCMQIERDLARLAPAQSRSLISRFFPHPLHVNHYAHSNILDILMHCTHGAQMRVAEASSRSADLVLRPEICDDRWLDFRNPGFYIRAGREIALRYLSEIKALINQKGAVHYEHESTPQPLAESVAA